MRMTAIGAQPALSVEGDYGMEARSGGQLGIAAQAPLDSDSEPKLALENEACNTTSSSVVCAPNVADASEWSMSPYLHVETNTMHC
jgi:hypothetical protein